MPATLSSHLNYTKLQNSLRIKIEGFRMYEEYDSIENPTCKPN